MFPCPLSLSAKQVRHSHFVCSTTFTWHVMVASCFPSPHRTLVADSDCGYAIFHQCLLLILIWTPLCGKGCWETTTVTPGPRVGTDLDENLLARTYLQDVNWKKNGRLEDKFDNTAALSVTFRNKILPSPSCGQSQSSQFPVPGVK